MEGLIFLWHPHIFHGMFLGWYTVIVITGGLVLVNIMSVARKTCLYTAVFTPHHEGLDHNNASCGISARKFMSLYHSYHLTISWENNNWPLLEICNPRNQNHSRLCRSISCLQSFFMSCRCSKAAMFYMDKCIFDIVCQNTISGSI